MRRAGGTAVVTSSPGAGTEVELTLPRAAAVIRVVLVDDHELFRAGVRGELGSAVEIVGEAGSVAEAVPLIRELDPEVVLLDVHLPDGGGEGVIAAVAQERPGVKFLALSVSDAAEDVIGVIRAGARGYVTKTISSEELSRRGAASRRGDAVFSPRLAGFVLDAFRDGARVGDDAELENLTAREREVLQLIARGYQYKEIAARLHLSVKTVEAHVSSVLRKLQLSSSGAPKLDHAGRPGGRDRDAGSMLRVVPECKLRPFPRCAVDRARHAPRSGRRGEYRARPSCGPPATCRACCISKNSPCSCAARRRRNPSKTSPKRTNSPEPITPAISPSHCSSQPRSNRRRSSSHARQMSSARYSTFAASRSRADVCSAS